MIQDFRDRGIYFTEDEYQTGLRYIFPEDYQDLSDEELEDMIYDSLAQLNPAEVESFMEGFGSWLKKAVHSAAPVVTAALPTVATAVGTAYGGPMGGAAAGALGNAAAGGISKATHTKPNPLVSSIGGVATAAASGNFSSAIPAAMNTARLLGNSSQSKQRNGATGTQPANNQRRPPASANNYGMSKLNTKRTEPTPYSQNTGNRPVSVVPSAQKPQPSYPAYNTASSPNRQTGQASQLLSFLGSAPFLQSLLLGVITGVAGAQLQIPRQDGSTASVNYVEMLEALKQLTENAIAEADNSGFSSSLPIESEDDKDAYIEALVEDINNYENSLLPNYDVITY